MEPEVQQTSPKVEKASSDSPSATVATRARTAPVRGGAASTTQAASARRRAAPSRAGSGSPARGQAGGAAGKPRRRAPARRADAVHARSTSSGGSSNAVITAVKLQQSNSEGSEDIAAVALSAVAPAGATAGHRPGSDPPPVDLDHSVLSRLEDLDAASGGTVTRGRERRGAVDVEEARFKPFNTSKRMFNIMVQVLGCSEKDKLMCEKIMRCSLKHSLLKEQEVISQHQADALKALEVKILAAFDQHLPPRQAD